MTGRVSLANPARGVTTKRVKVEAIQDKYVTCRDGAGYHHQIPLGVYPTKGFAPKVGETWMISNDLGAWYFAAVVGYTPLSGARAMITYTTPALASGASHEDTIALPAAYRLYTIQTSRPARVRLYDLAATQSSDLARVITTDPGPGVGIMLDYLTVDSLLSATLSPLVDGVDLSNAPDGAVPITVQNTDTATGTVSVEFTYIRTE